MFYSFDLVANIKDLVKRILSQWLSKSLWIVKLKRTMKNIYLKYKNIQRKYFLKSFQKKKSFEEKKKESSSHILQAVFTNTFYMLLLFGP